MQKSVSSRSPGKPSLMQNGHLTARTPLPQQLQFTMPSGDAQDMVFPRPQKVLLLGPEVHHDSWLHY